MPMDGTRSPTLKLDLVRSQNMRLKDLSRLVPSEEHGDAPAIFYWLHIVVATITAALLVLAVTDMLVGVLLRYVVSKISVFFNLPGVDFFWVEEIGEFALAWMTMLGAALGIAHGTHFKLQVVTHLFPEQLQLVVARISGLLIVGFGAVAATFGMKVAILNSQSVSPGLSINLFWLYFSTVAGGVLIMIFGLLAAIAPRLVDSHDLYPGVE
jgi:TRAP-type C4-dicarboxylate transport system permease small subunit